MIEFTQLEQFMTIAEEGTLSKAAEVLLISQPALTRSVQRLESELGLQLFERTKNKVTLNDSGKLAVKLFQKLLTERDQMITSLQSYENSKISYQIGSCAPMPLTGLRYIFSKSSPDRKITDVLDSDNHKLLEGLRTHQFSIVVLTQPIQNEEFESIKLFEETLYLSVPPAHPLALYANISFSDLDGESVLLLSRIGFWNEICLQMIPHSHLLIQEDQAVFDELTKASALPNFRSNITMLSDQTEKNRVAIPIIDQQAHATYYAVYRKENRQLFSILEKEFEALDWKLL